MTKLIDKYLPEYTYSEYHDTIINSTSVDDVYEIARDLDLSKSRVIPLLFKLRGLPTHSLNALGFINAMGFSNIEERVPHERLLGYLKTNRIEPYTGYEDYVNNTIGADLKVAFSFQYASLNAKQVKLSTETRVLCTNAKAHSNYRFYWYAIRPFSGWIRREILRLIKAEAEASPYSSLSY